MKKVILPFGLLVFAVLVLYQTAKFSRFRGGPQQELWLTIFSLAFLGIGIFLSRKMQPKIIISEKEPPPPTGEPSFTPDSRQIEKLNLSKRELEVLILINEGLSNQQIADRLYVSENTIKKHISSIFLKMDVERRTEAIKKGKSMGILS